MSDYTKQGWVRFYRKSMDSTVWKNPIIWFVWSWCMLKANHEDNTFPFNGTDITVKKGSFIASLSPKELTHALSTQNIRTAFNYLKSTGRITIESNNKFSLITIVKWSDYQVDNRLPNKPVTNEQQTSNKPVTTNKNEKKVKKETTGAKLQVVAMTDEDKPQKVKKERVIPLPYSWKTTRDAWQVEDRRYLRVLGWYLSRKELWPTLTSEGRVSAVLARLKGIAVKIADGEWTSDELNAACERIATNPKLNIEWTLETVERYLIK